MRKGMDTVSTLYQDAVSCLYCLEHSLAVDVLVHIGGRKGAQIGHNALFKVFLGEEKLALLERLRRQRRQQLALAS